MYFYYNNNWQQKREQIAQFKTKINQPLEIEEEVEIELERLTKEKEQEVEISSPFKSELKLEEVTEDLKQQESNSESGREETKVSRPDFKLLGILRNDERALVTVRTAQEIERLTFGEVIDGFKLVEINKNNVVFKKGRSFTFWLGERPYGEKSKIQKEGGHQN